MLGSAKVTETENTSDHKWSSDHRTISDLQFIFRIIFCVFEMNKNSGNASFYKLALYVTYFMFLWRSHLLPLSQQSSVSGLETLS